MKIFILLLIGYCQIASAEIPEVLALKSSPYDVVVPMLVGNPSTKVAGQLYYDVTASAFKGIDSSGNVATFRTGGGGITQLTGAVTAGPGSGSQVATITSPIGGNMDFANYRLWDSTGTNAIHWGQRILQAPNVATVLNWDSGFLADPTSTPGNRSLHWFNRQLIANDGSTVVANWSSSTSLTIGAYQIPLADGSAGQVLKTNGSGTVSWADPSPSGTLCGWSDSAFTQNCQGFNPSSSCPSGYTQRTNAAGAQFCMAN